jgi:hypothetical protein
MLDLYKTMTGADGILIDSDDTPSFRVTANISIGNTIEPIQGADIIMSFVNHGKCNVKSDNGWSYLPVVWNACDDPLCCNSFLHKYKV